MYDFEYFVVSWGELAEWSNAAVLKTVEPKGSGGSNPSPSATKCITLNDKTDYLNFVVKPPLWEAEVL